MRGAKLKRGGSSSDHADKYDEFFCWKYKPIYFDIRVVNSP